MLAQRLAGCDIVPAQDLHIGEIDQQTLVCRIRQQARADLYLFGVKLYADAIAGALSMDNVLPRGTYVEFDADEYLEENFMADKMDSTETVIEENTQEELANR